MIFNRPLKTAAAVLALGSVPALAAPAFAAAPAEFTSQGVAKSYNAGKATTVPNTLYYDHGKIRLEMAHPVAAEGTSAFSVVITREGGNTLTMLNPKTKEAMKLDSSSLEALTDSEAMQKISAFKLSEFGKTFRAQSKKIGTASVAGQPCSILEQKGKNGHFKLWLSDRYEIPLKFTYYEGAKPAFEYEVSKLTLSSSLPDSAFVVPKGYEMTDLSEALKNTEINIRKKK
jgi:outer membrane lipoprotein-sorting protein